MIQANCVRLFVVLAVFGCCGCGGQTPPVTNGASAAPKDDCPAGERYPMTASPSEAVKPVTTWKGDVNGDGHGDLLLVDRDACSNWGDCPYTLFLTCQSRQVPLWSGYAHRVTPVTSKTKWKELEVVQRDAVAGKDKASRFRVRFDGRKYTEVAGSRQKLRPNQIR